MNHTELILTAFLALFGGLNIFQFLFFRSTKKTYAANAEKASQQAMTVSRENDSKAVETLKEVIDELRESLEIKSKELKEKEDIIDSLKEDKYIAANHLCLHMGCVLRRPDSGMGARWLELNRERTTLDVDYMPINMLLKDYGANKDEIIKHAVNGTPIKEEKIDGND